VIEPKVLVDRYVAMWNEPDAELRRRTIREMWAKDAVHILQPPQEIREAAASLGLTPALEARGHDALELRVARAYEEFVEPGKFVFKPRDNAARLRDVVTFTWEMVPADGGEAVGGGLEFLVLGEDDQIRVDYQFIDA
jgi:hypothetical protein